MASPAPWRPKLAGMASPSTRWRLVISQPNSTPRCLNDEAFTKWVEARTPAGRWAKPEELGGAVVFLASDAAAYVNGHVLAVDGGLSTSL